jgi:hypothetical protein
MTRQEVLNNQMDEIMDTFDFDKVNKMMCAVDWKWATTENEVPDQYELRKSARRLMKQAIAGEDCATGGFRAWVIDGKDNNGPWTRLNLMFGEDIMLDGETHE